jgi:dephospho-CoA kinase
MELLKKEGVEINRESLINKGNELRAEYGPSALIDLLYKEAQKTNQNCIIESIRTVGEIDSLKNKGKFLLLAVDAESKIRYGRVVIRGSDTDKISFKDFVRQEKMEMENKDVNKQNVAECIKRADYKLDNNGNLEELERKINDIFDVRGVGKEHGNAIDTKTDTSTRR